MRKIACTLFKTNQALIKICITAVMIPHQTLSVSIYFSHLVLDLAQNTSKKVRKAKAESEQEPW